MVYFLPSYRLVSVLAFFQQRLRRLVVVLIEPVQMVLQQY
jgi:hypothetical protein